MIAAFYRDGVKVEGTDAMCQTTTPMFSPMDANLASEAEFELKAGCDLNGNGVLDGDEAAELVVQDMDGEAIGPPIVSVISNLQYEDDVQFVNGIVNLSHPVLHHAARLLKIFRDGHTGGIPQDYCPFDLSGTAVSLGAFDDCSGFSEWLTHNSGAPFDGDGICSIKEYHWLPDSSLATLVATAKPLNPLVGAAYQSWVVSRFYETVVRPQAAAYLRTNPVGTIATFPLDGGFYEMPLMQYQQEADAPFQPAWVEGTTILVHNLDGESCQGLLILIDDANGSIGRGRLTNIGYQFSVEKVEAWANLACLESIRVVGTIEDLYDFNRESGGAASAAASLQIGHGNGSYGSGRDRGKIFRTRVDVDHIFHPNGIGFAAVEIPE